MDIDTWVGLAPYPKSGASRAALRCVSPLYRHGPLCDALYLQKPWRGVYRRRIWGFGKPTVGRGLALDEVSISHAIHHVWQWLIPSERHNLTQASSVLRAYALLRYRATYESIGSLQSRTAAPTKPTGLSMEKAIKFSCALLRFDFIYGDFQRWLGGEYTNRNRDWPAVFEQLLSASHRPPPPGQPPPDYNRSFRVTTEGVPLKANYQCPLRRLLAVFGMTTIPPSLIS